MSTLITIQATPTCFQVKVAKSVIEFPFASDAQRVAQLVCARDYAGHAAKSNKDLRIKDLTEKHHALG